MAKAISWLGRQQEEENRRRLTTADLLSSFVLTFHQPGVLHIEGIPLDAAKLSFLEYLVLASSKRNSILRLELRRCDLGKNATNVVGRAASNGLTTLQALSSLLRNLPNLQSIDLSCNQFENEDVAQVFEALASHNLKELILEDNCVKAQEGGSLVRQFLGSQPTLRLLNVAENVLTSKGALEVALGLAEHGQIEDLDLACCEIAKDDVSTWNSLGKSVFDVLADSLLQNPNLLNLRLSVAESGIDESFVLSMNGSRRDVSPLPSESGTLALARLLEEHPSLESLAVIQSPGFLCPDSLPAANRRFADALGYNHTLDRFALEGCGICDETVKLLCEEVLQWNPVMRHLDLLSNDLGEKGHRYLNEALPRMQHLRTLLLEGATMDYPDDFTAALKQNTSLTYVQAVDTPNVDISPIIDEITHRNDMIHKAKTLLNDNENRNDQIWGNALASFARKPSGNSALFHILSRKSWIQSSRERPRKRQRVAYSK